MAVSPAPTGQLDTATRRAAQLLVDGAFAGDVSDDDRADALGGVHAPVHDGADLVAHGAVVPRRRGVASAVMAALEGVVRERYELGGLSATDDGAALYRARLAAVAGEHPGDDAVRPAPHPRGRRRGVRAPRDRRPRPRRRAHLRRAPRRPVVGPW